MLKAETQPIWPHLRHGLFARYARFNKLVTAAEREAGKYDFLNLEIHLVQAEIKFQVFTHITTVDVTRLPRLVAVTYVATNLEGRPRRKFLVALPLELCNNRFSIFGGE
jgi:hypothetical protein